MSNDRFDLDTETTSLWNDYEHGLAYQASTGLSKKIPTFVKFYEGDQWPPATKNTKNLPRPVVNIIKMITYIKSIIKKANQTNKNKVFLRFAIFSKTLKNNPKKICSG